MPEPAHLSWTQASTPPRTLAPSVRSWRGPAADEPGTQLPAPVAHRNVKGRNAPGWRTERESEGRIWQRDGLIVYAAGLVCLLAMFPRVSAILPLRPVSRFPLYSGGSEATIVLLGAPHGTVRYRISALLALRVLRQPPGSLRGIQWSFSASWGGCSSPRDLRGRCFKAEEREIPES